MSKPPMLPRIITPWSPGQIEALNAWQFGERTEVFRCEGEHWQGPPLTATEEGFACESCDYRLDWAYAFMAMSDHMVCWGTDCAECARLLDSCYAETVRAEKAEEQVRELTAELNSLKGGSNV